MKTETTDYRAALYEAFERTREELAFLEAAVRVDGPTIKGARGNVVAHPALAAIARHRKTLADLVKALDPNAESTSDKARRAAKARWENARHPRDRVFVPAESNGDTL